ncbi:hypothetical protein C8F01DRAFT_1262668 [Mycena amicta]|nr:hypothetical protein C8F01DRAFT_1262668 [Mycena amicta]
MSHHKNVLATSNGSVKGRGSSHDGLGDSSHVRLPTAFLRRRILCPPLDDNSTTTLALRCTFFPGDSGTTSRQHLYGDTCAQLRLTFLERDPGGLPLDSISTATYLRRLGNMRSRAHHFPGRASSKALLPGLHLDGILTVFLWRIGYARACVHHFPGGTMSKTLFLGLPLDGISMYFYGDSDMRSCAHHLPGAKRSKTLLPGMASDSFFLSSFSVSTLAGSGALTLPGRLEVAAEQLALLTDASRESSRLYLPPRFVSAVLHSFYWAGP